MPDVFQGRSATLRIGDQLVDLRHGDTVPSGADKATVDAMREAGAFTPPPAADALASELSANELARREFGLVGDPERDLAPEPALSAAADVPSLPAEPSVDQVNAFLDEASVDQVVNAAGEDKALAQRLLDAENARDRPRKGVIDGLTKVIDE
jgi:hypothetical protein